MSPRWEVAVLIPARNEEVLLARCLESVIRAIDRLPATTRASVVLVSDSSTDRTAEIAHQLIDGRGGILHTGAGTVGTARALAASYAIERAAVTLCRVWLANTDADCVVPSDWLSCQIELASAGIEGLAGIVAVDSFDEHGPEVPARFQAHYSVHGDRTHAHVHGANLGVRADCYVAVGGWADLKTGEDHDLWGRLRRTGVCLLSSTQLRVLTCGRRIGRAPSGFAAALAAHNDPVLFV